MQRERSAKERQQALSYVPFRVALGAVGFQRTGPILGATTEAVMAATKAPFGAVREQERRRSIGIDFRLRLAHHAGAQLRRDPFPLRYGT